LPFAAIRKGKEIYIETQDTTFLSRGKEIKLRIFTPEGNGPFPIVLYYHGGGFALRNIECFDYIGR
jgi:acetyl esterase